MTVKWFVKGFAVALAAATVATAAPALARSKHRHPHPPRCVDRPGGVTLGDIFFSPRPEANGCAPPVYVDGMFMGQDPDPNVRLQLQRDPLQGHANSDSW